MDFHLKFNLRKPGKWSNLLLFLLIAFLTNNFLKFQQRKHEDDIDSFRPAPLRKVFGSGYSNSFRAEENYENPLVFMVSSSTSDSLMPQQYVRKYPKNKDENVIFIFSQGTYRNISRGRVNIQYKLDVTGCLIGDIEYPVALHSFGVYICSAKLPPKIGDEISLIVSPKIYRHSPSNKTLENYVINIIKDNKISGGRFLIPSTVKWKGQKDEEQKANETKYEICAMTQERLFPELLHPWIEYHRRIGIDRFYIYDNAGEVNLTKELYDRDDTEVVYWPWARSQLQAQNHWILHGRRRCHWMIMFDVDEYIGLRMKGPWANSMNPLPGQLKTYVRYAKTLNVSELSLDQIKMGSSGYLRQQTNRAPPEVFIHKLPTQEKTPKSLFYGMQ